MKPSAKKIALCVLAGALVLINTVSLLPGLWKMLRDMPVGMADLAAHPAQSVATATECVEQYCNQESALYTLCREVRGALYRLINKQVIRDPETDVYRLKNGRLTTVFPARDEEICREAQENLLSFKQFLDAQGIAFLYVSPPSKSDETQGQFPAGVRSHYRENTLALHRFLDENGIASIDMAAEIHADGLDFYDMFYRTDHHWTVQSGRWAAQKITAYMQDTLGWELDASLLLPEKWQSVVYEKMLLGSLGKKTGYGYMPAEDFELLLPAFETQFHFEDVYAGVQKCGSFEEAFIIKENLTRDYYHAYPYFVYMNGDRPLMRIENLTCDNGKRICIFRDSMAAVVTPFLACEVQYLDIIDLRPFDGSVREWILESRPDMVINLMTPKSAQGVTVMEWVFD